MSSVSEQMATKRAKKTKKKVVSINNYKQQIPAFVMVDGVKHVTHEEIAGRCMTTADMIARQTKGEFLRLYAEPDAIPLCYMLFAYHQNMMVVSDMSKADIYVEVYEHDEAPHIMGTKDDVVYLALFKEDEGHMPWTFI